MCREACPMMPYIAPVYFAVFVLASQFVLVNVVVAVLMKQLEDAKLSSSDDDVSRPPSSLISQDFYLKNHVDPSDAKLNDDTNIETAFNENDPLILSERQPYSTDCSMIANHSVDGVTSNNTSLMEINNVDSTLENSTSLKFPSENEALEDKIRDKEKHERSDNSSENSSNAKMSDPHRTNGKELLRARC